MPAPADHRYATDRGEVVVRFTGRAQGDLNADVVAPDVLARRWRAVAGRPVTWLDEVHGADVVVVREPGGSAGATADAAVTDVAGAALGVWVGDCAPVALVSRSGAVGVAHAGWKGVEAGVLGRAVEHLAALGATDVQAVLGPCIHPGCYEFGTADLDRLAGRFGSGVLGTTAWGTPALDVPALVAAALAAEGIVVDSSASVCTACTPGYWSHRARGDRGRQGVVTWLAPA